ncbi:MAG: hypothetical protein LBJ00_09560 [Planctomycetaceae bacterium]|nr:hypothetical protein [Planctomycetaceae bacterium]
MKRLLKGEAYRPTGYGITVKNALVEQDGLTSKRNHRNNLHSRYRIPNTRWSATKQFPNC